MDFILEVQRREAVGKAAARRFRSGGLIPSIVYHRGEDSVPALVPQKEFIQLATKARTTQVFRLKSQDQLLNGRSVLVREVRRDSLKGHLLHVDFQALKEDEEIHVRVSLQLVGEAPGVKTEGGILSIVTHEIGVACFPRDIPQKLDVDISALRLGGSIHAGDVGLPKGVRLTDDREETIVSVVAVRASVGDAAPVEDAAAAAAKGAAAATPSKAAAPKSGGGKK